MYPSEDGDEDTLKKAREIAAAPELLEFAEQIFKGHRHGNAPHRFSCRRDTRGCPGAGVQGSGQSEGPEQTAYPALPSGSQTLTAAVAR